MSTVQLFSGGLDSVCLWAVLGHPAAVYVRTGHAYQDAEIDAVASLTEVLPDLRVIILDGPDLGWLEMPDGHVPHRNINLLATVAACTDADRLVLGALLGEASPDKSRRFLRAASRALTASEGRPLQVVAPAARWTKTRLLREALQADHRIRRVIGRTRSCYAPEGECGQCQACFRRHVALYRCGLTDEPPQMPEGWLASGKAGMKQAGFSRWPALAVNNAGAALAVAGIRRGA